MTFGAIGRTRTDTVRVLNPLPLPLRYDGHGADGENCTPTGRVLDPLSLLLDYADETIYRSSRSESLMSDVINISIGCGSGI